MLLFFSFFVFFLLCYFFFFFQAEDGIRDIGVTGVQTCALPILFVCDERLHEDVDGAAARETQIAGEIGVQMMGQEGGPAVRLRVERRADDLRLHAPAADGAEQPALGSDEHLRTGRYWSRPAGTRDRRERPSRAGRHQISRDAPNVHATNIRAPRLTLTVFPAVYGVTTI